jgi:hypothetical protein
MSDICAGFHSPCIADLKLGTRTSDISPDPRHGIWLQCYCKASTSAQYGVRLVSPTILRSGEVVRSSRKSGNLRLSVAALRRKIAGFLPPEIRARVTERLATMRQAFAELLKMHPNFRIYSGSLVICYDGDDLAAAPRLAMFDWAHCHLDIARDGGDPGDPAFDDGVLKGFNSLLAFLEAIARENGRRRASAQKLE